MIGAGTTVLCVSETVTTSVSLRNDSSFDWILTKHVSNWQVWNSLSSSNIDTLLSHSYVTCLLS
jgi:hypothetical protein